MAVLLLALALAARADSAHAMIREYGLDPDFAATLRVQMIGNRLAQAAGLPNAEFQIINQRELNAMAFPDGRIYITNTLARSVTDDELAFVLGHEITHITEGHAKNQITRATGGAIFGALLAVVLGGSASDIRAGADIVGGLTYGHYSRKDENRADAGGVRLMAQAGYDPKEAADAMQRLIDAYGPGDAKVPVLGWFASHPDSNNRKNRILELADQLENNPIQPLPPPLGVEVVLDESARHAQAWLPDYSAILLAAMGEGKVVSLNPSAAMTTITSVPAPEPVAQDTEVIIEMDGQPEQAKPEPERTDDKQKDVDASKEDKPLPEVTVRLPEVPAAYRIVLALRPIPAGGAAQVEDAQGTAVEATLRWTDLATGMGDTITAVAQTTEPVPWKAHEQLPDPTDARKLEDGKQANIEGTLEATAVRRTIAGFAEVIKSGGLVDHSAPVTLRLSKGAVRVNDYVAVVRKDRVVSMVRVTALNGKEVTGLVLWGAHTWQRKDQFLPAQ
jgi:hypothetical protein